MNHPVNLCEKCQGSGISGMDLEPGSTSGDMMKTCPACKGIGLDQSTLPPEAVKAVKDLLKATTTRDAIGTIVGYHSEADVKIRETDALLRDVFYDHDGRVLRRIGVSVTFYLDT